MGRERGDVGIETQRNREREIERVGETVEWERWRESAREGERGREMEGERGREEGRGT